MAVRGRLAGASLRVAGASLQIAMEVGAPRNGSPGASLRVAGRLVAGRHTGRHPPTGRHRIVTEPPPSRREAPRVQIATRTAIGAVAIRKRGALRIASCRRAVLCQICTASRVTIALTTRDHLRLSADTLNNAAREPPCAGHCSKNEGKPLRWTQVMTICPKWDPNLHQTFLSDKRRGSTKSENLRV